MSNFLYFGLVILSGILRTESELDFGEVVVRIVETLQYTLIFMIYFDVMEETAKWSICISPRFGFGDFQVLALLGR